MERSSNYSDSVLAGGHTVGSAAALTTSFRHPFIYDGRYACYDNPGCDLDDESGPEEDESDDDKLDVANVKRSVGSAYERVVEGLGDSQDIDGYEGDSDEYGDSYGDGFYSYHRHDMFGDVEDDDDNDEDCPQGASYSTYEELTAQDLQDYMHQQQLDYAYSLRRYSLLETIHEETAEELRSDSESRSEVSDYSGVWCWGDDFADGAESVIYIEQQQGSEGQCDDHSVVQSEDTTDKSSETVCDFERTMFSDSTSDRDNEKTVLSGTMRCTSHRTLEDPSEREGSWLDAEVDETLDDSGSNSALSTNHLGNTTVDLKDSASVDDNEESDGDVHSYQNEHYDKSLISHTVGTHDTPEISKDLEQDIDRTTSQDSRNAESDDSSETDATSAVMLCYLNTFDRKHCQDIADPYQSLLSLHSKSPITGGDSDLLIVFDDMESEDLPNQSPLQVVPLEGKSIRYCKRPSTAPPPPPVLVSNRVSDENSDNESNSAGSSSGNSEFSSWSDAIDAYLMSRAVHQQQKVGESTSPLSHEQSNQVPEIATKRNPTECIISPIPAKIQRLSHYRTSPSDDGSVAEQLTRGVGVGSEMMDTSGLNSSDDDGGVSGARGEGKSCYRSVILGSDLSIDLHNQDALAEAQVLSSLTEEDIYRAPSSDHQSHESPTSSPKDESLAAFGRLETMVRTDGDGAEQQPSFSSCTVPLEDEQNTLSEVDSDGHKQKLLFRCHQELRLRRLSGTNSEPDLRIVDTSKNDVDDGIPTHYHFGEFILDNERDRGFHLGSIDDSYSLKSQSVPCGIDKDVMDDHFDGHLSRTGNRRSNAADSSNGGMIYKGDVFSPPSPLKRQSFTFDGMGNDLSACQLDNLHYSKAFTSRFNPTATTESGSSHNSSCDSDQEDTCDTQDSVEEEEDDDDEGVDDLSSRNSSSLFPRFTPPSTLRSFRSFDTLHLTGKNEEDEEDALQPCGQPSPPPSLRNHHHRSWMDGIEECSEREEAIRPTRPSSENLSEDSGYCDSSQFGRAVSGNGSGTATSNFQISCLEGQTSEIHLSKETSEEVWRDKENDKELSCKHGPNFRTNEEQGGGTRVYVMNEVVIPEDVTSGENAKSQGSTIEVYEKNRIAPVGCDDVTSRILQEDGENREEAADEKVRPSLPIDDEVSGPSHTIESRPPQMVGVIMPCRGDKEDEGSVNTKERVNHLDIINNISVQPSCQKGPRLPDSTKPSSLPSSVNQQLESRTSCLHQNFQENDVIGTTPPLSILPSPLSAQPTLELPHSNETLDRTEKFRQEDEEEEEEGDDVPCSQVWDEEECGPQMKDQTIPEIALPPLTEQKVLVEGVIDNSSEQLPIVSRRFHLEVHTTDVTEEPHRSNWHNPIPFEIPSDSINEESNSRSEVEAPPTFSELPLHSSLSSSPLSSITYSSPHLPRERGAGHTDPSDGAQVLFQECYSMISDRQLLHLQDYSATQHDEKVYRAETGSCQMVVISRETTASEPFVTIGQGRTSDTTSEFVVSDFADPVTVGINPMAHVRQQQIAKAVDKHGRDRDHDYVMETDITLDISSNSIPTSDHHSQNEVVCSSVSSCLIESLKFSQTEARLSTSGGTPTYQTNVSYQKMATGNYSSKILSTYQSASRKMTTSTTVVDSGPGLFSNDSGDGGVYGDSCTGLENKDDSGCDLSYVRHTPNGNVVRLDTDLCLKDDGTTDATRVSSKTELRIGRCRNGQEEVEEEMLDAEVAEALSAGSLCLVESSSTINTTSSVKTESVCAKTEVRYVQDTIGRSYKRPGDDDVHLEFKSEVVTSTGSVGGEGGRATTEAAASLLLPQTTTIKTTTDIVISTIGGTTTTTKSFVSGALPAEGVVGIEEGEVQPSSLDRVKTDGEWEEKERADDGKCGPFQRECRKEEEEQQQQCLELLHPTSLNSNSGFQSALVKERQHHHRQFSLVTGTPESRVHFDDDDDDHAMKRKEKRLLEKSSQRISWSGTERVIDDEFLNGGGGPCDDQNLVSNSREIVHNSLTTSLVSGDAIQDDMEKRGTKGGLLWISSPTSMTSSSVWSKDCVDGTDDDDFDVALCEGTSIDVSDQNVEDYHQWDGSSIDCDSDDETEGLPKEDEHRHYLAEVRTRKSGNVRFLTEPLVDKLGCQDEIINGGASPKSTPASTLAFGTSKERLTPGKPPLPPHHHHHNAHHGQHQAVPKQVAVCRSKIIDAKQQFFTTKTAPLTSSSISREACSPDDDDDDDNYRSSSNGFETVPVLTHMKTAECVSIVNLDNDDNDLKAESRWLSSEEAAGGTSGVCIGEEIQRADVLQALEKCRQKALEGRERIAKTVLDLNQVERAVRIQQQQQLQQRQQQPRAGGGSSSLNIDLVPVGVVLPERKEGFCSSVVEIADDGSSSSSSNDTVEARSNGETTKTLSFIPSNGVPVSAEPLNSALEQLRWSSLVSKESDHGELKVTAGDCCKKTTAIDVDGWEHKQQQPFSESEKLLHRNSRGGSNDSDVVESPSSNLCITEPVATSGVSPFSSVLPSGGIRRSSYGRKSSATSSSSWRGSSQSIGYLETDIDTLHSREVIRVNESSSSSVADTAEEVVQDHHNAINGRTFHGLDGIGSVGKQQQQQRRRLSHTLKTQSMFNLTAENGCQDGDTGIARCPLDIQLAVGGGGSGTTDGIGSAHRQYYGVVENNSNPSSSSSRAKSVEFLLKDENKMAALPPENRLQQQVQGSGGGRDGSGHDGSGKQHSDEQQRVLSEHELRIRRSLQKLDLPQWYTSSPISQMGSAEGFILRKDPSKTSLESTSSRYPRWADIRSSKSSSNLGSVSGSAARMTVAPSRNVVISKRVTTGDMRHVKSSRESLLQSPLSPSPLPSPKEKSGSFQYYGSGGIGGYTPSSVMSRWSSSRFSTSTTASSRSTSPTGSLQYQRALPFQRQPYLGWRSSERLAREMVTLGQSPVSGGDNASDTPTHGGYFYRSSAERLSQGPGYYALRFGLYRSPGSDGNLLHQGFSRRGSNTSTATAPPDTYRTGRGDSAASPVSVGSMSLKTTGGFDESFGITHLGDTRPEITVNVFEPNGAGCGETLGKPMIAHHHNLGRSPGADDIDGEQPQTLQVADLVREIDKLIHRNGASVENGEVNGTQVLEQPSRSVVHVHGHQQQHQHEDLCSGAAGSQRSPVLSTVVTHDDRDSAGSPTLSARGGDRQKVAWMESSFVGVRPVYTATSGSSPSPSETSDIRSGSPQKHHRSSSETAKTTITSQAQVHPPPPALFRTPSMFKQESTERRQSLNSTTLEEVLDSLLALPSSSQSPSPSGYRAPKWETEDGDDPSPGGRNMTNKSARSEHDTKSQPDTLSAIVGVKDTVAPVRLSLDATNRTRSGGSDAGSSHSSMVSSSSSSSSTSSGPCHHAHDDDNIDRGSYSSSSSSSGTDRLTTGTTMTTSSNTSGLSRVSDYASSSDAASLSGQSPRSSVSSSSVSGSGKEVIPPPPDFMDRSSEVCSDSPSFPSSFPGRSSAQMPVAEAFQKHIETTDKMMVTTHHQEHSTPTQFQGDSFPATMLCTAVTSDTTDENIVYTYYGEQGEGMDTGNNLQNSRKESVSSSNVKRIGEAQQLQYDYEFTAEVPDDSHLDSNLGDPQTTEALNKVSEVENNTYDDKSRDIVVGDLIEFSSNVACVDTEHVLSQSVHDPGVPKNYSPSVDTRFSSSTTLQETTTTGLRDDDPEKDEMIQLGTSSIDVDFEDDDKPATACHTSTIGTATKDRRIIRADMLDDTVIVRCSNDQCKNSAELRDARKTFKTCHNCYTYYCSRECRKDHWMRHRRVCMYGRIRSMCKQAIQCSRDNPNVLLYLSKLAQTGYITQGRGFVKMVFRNTDLAVRFLRQGWSQLEDGPIYVNWRDLIPQEMGDEVYRAIVDLCQRYEPDTKFILLVAIFITREVPIQSVPHWEREVIAKCAKVPLSKLAISNRLDGHGLVNDDPNTLVITGPQQIKGADAAAAKKTREVCLANIEEQLRERGVSLRHQFPDIYGRLCSYVDNDDPFPPLTIYPKDGRTGHTFVCVIVPNSGAPPLHDWLKTKAK